MLRRAFTQAAALLALAAAVHASDVLVVAQFGGPGVDHTQIQPAVDAAKERFQSAPIESVNRDHVIREGGELRASGGRFNAGKSGWGKRDG